MSELVRFLEWVVEEEGSIQDVARKWLQENKEVEEGAGKLTVAETLECSEESEGLEGFDWSNVEKVLGIREPLKNRKEFLTLIEGKNVILDKRKKILFEREGDSWYRRVYEEEHEVFFEKSNGWWYRRDVDRSGNTISIKTSDDMIWLA